MTYLIISVHGLVNTSYTLNLDAVDLSLSLSRVNSLRQRLQLLHLTYIGPQSLDSLSCLELVSGRFHCLDSHQSR